MKSPRKMLLARHETIKPRLDDIRQDVVGKLNNKATKQQSFPSAFVSWFLCCSKNIWLELIWPSRRTWAGLAGVWVLILAANFSMRDHSPTKIPKYAPEMIMTLRQQQQLLSELNGGDDPPVAEARKSYLPRPASERNRSANFQVCCVPGFQARQPSVVAQFADLEIGDTAGLETCATSTPVSHYERIAKT